ncbi:MAG: SOS response-associated peptidase [Pseudomonadales bacterium]|nr:SOS response-associated peptidase [Pseudomonadales bacterium]
MCGRLNIIADPLVQLLMQTVGQRYAVTTKLNVAPTESVPVLRYEDGWSLTEMRWWLVPCWSDGPSSKFSMFNARSETLTKSRAYREPFASRRCVIPVSGYYEWRSSAGQRQPMYFTPEDGSGFLLAGLWDAWQSADGALLSCSIITASAPPQLSRFHHRVPVQLAASDLMTWLDEGTSIQALADLMQSGLPGPIVVCDVSRAVNNARYKDERCLQALTEPEIIL